MWHCSDVAIVIALAFFAINSRPTIALRSNFSSRLQSVPDRADRLARIAAPATSSSFPYFTAVVFTVDGRVCDVLLDSFVPQSSWGIQSSRIKIFRIHFGLESIMWLTCFSILVAILIWQAWTAGPHRALGVVVVLSLLVPGWLSLEVAGQPLHMRAAAGIAGLAVYCLHPKSTFNLHLNSVDLCGLALLAVHVTSDWMNDGFNWTVPLRAYGEWAVPYLCGRLALQNIDDVRALLPFVVAVSMVLAAVSTIESVTRVNVVEVAFGNRPIDRTRREAERLGLKRAFGPTLHAIFFGTLQVLLFPWTLYAAARTQHRAGPRWWKWTPWFAGAGVFFTVSRAPQLAVGIVLYITAMMIKPQYRKWLIGIGAAGVVSSLMAWQSVLYVIHLIGGEQKTLEKHHPTVVIEGETQPTSSALARVHFFDIYGLAMRRAGWLGFGTDRTTGFPPRVPIGQQHVETLKRIWTLDNTYILVVLRFGYLGLACFVLMGMTAIVEYVLLGWRPQVPGAVFFASMAGTLMATMLILLTVYMPHDFGFWYLWSVGTASGLCGSKGLSKRFFDQKDVFVSGAQQVQ